jgi:uncharacterized protein with PhoU and TrkA domain
MVRSMVGIIISLILSFAVSGKHQLSRLSRLGQCRLNEEDLLALGICRTDGSYVGTPKRNTRINADDLLILYGRGWTLKNLDKRQAAVRGEVEHGEAVQEQKIHGDEQDKKEDEYRRKKRLS